MCHSIQSYLDIRGHPDCFWKDGGKGIVYDTFLLTNCVIFLTVQFFYLESPPRVIIGLPSPEVIHFVLFLRWRKRHINQTIHQQQQEINHSLIPQDSASFTLLSFLFLSLYKGFFFLESMHLFNQAKCINIIDKEKHLFYRIEALWWLMWQFELMYDHNKK